LPLRYKLSIYFFGFSAIMLVCLWIFQTAFLELSYTAIKLNQVKSSASAIATSIKYGNDTTSTINQLSKENEMSVYVYNSTETILIQQYSSDYNNPTGHSDMEMHTVYNYYREAKDNGGRYITTTSALGDSQKQFVAVYGRDATDDEASGVQFEIRNNRDGKGRSNVSNMVYAEIMDLDESNECFLLITAMITPVNAVVNTLRVQLTIVSIVFVILSIILAFIVSKHISRPIGEINTAVKELAKQNYDVEFSGSGYLEVKELSDTLNLTRQELERVEKLQQELIANISHDLRTPLTMITGYGEVMRDLPGENTPENVQVIIDEANRLTSLVNDMLDLSKLKSGAMELEKIHYSLTDSIYEIFKRYGKLREQDGYDIQFIADKNVYVYADEIKMGQVIYNFINNAINHCGDDKKVIVTQKVSGGKVRIEVTDHGEGISEDKLQYIWDRYYKVDKVHKRGVIGTGLGLSIVKRILDLHNARYGVKSKVGSGSTFWFELECD
jgi:signal transduction histidine kinase